MIGLDVIPEPLPPDPSLVTAIIIGVFIVVAVIALVIVLARRRPPTN